MLQMPYVHDRRAITDARDLIEAYGAGAGYEAAMRADKSRDIGNHIHFCHWRQIERLIVLLSVERAIGTLH